MADASYRYRGEIAKLRSQNDELKQAIAMQTEQVGDLQARCNSLAWQVRPPDRAS